VTGTTTTMQVSGDVMSQGAASGSTYRVGVIAGDGIGPEVVREARGCMEAVAEIFGFRLHFEEFKLGADHYLKTGELIDETTLTGLSRQDDLLLGAVGDPRVEPGILERGVILKIRGAFDQAVNVRPARLLPGVISPLRDLTPARYNIVVVRENTEGMYTNGGSIVHGGTPWTVAIQQSISTHQAVSRTIRFAFDLAARRRSRVTLCHKTNVLTEAGRVWMDAFDEVAADYGDVARNYFHIDACCVHLLERPEQFDVIVTENLFGDILSDLTAGIQGGLGLAPSGNLNLTRESPSMFEPVHGSAPDIVGTGRAHPGGAIFAGAMLLSHLGETPAASCVEQALTSVLDELSRASDGRARRSTREIGGMTIEEIHRRGSGSELDASGFVATTASPSSLAIA
jgi:3-isopropylmalate dehydrogenase